jgi:T5orf172 domain
MTQGFVYILVSPNSNFIKIGGTERPISERLRGINGTEAYADHGPWHISDFLHVTDWRLVEGGLHRYFQERNVRDVLGAHELFSVPPYEARKQLRETDPPFELTMRKPNSFLQIVTFVCTFTDYSSFRAYLVISTFKGLGH